MSDGPNLRNLMETWQRVQEQLNQAKDALGDKQVEGETGGGLVRCVVNGRSEVLSITIEPSLLGGADKKMIEDLLVGAVNLALERARQVAQEDLAAVAGGLAVPPGGAGE
ncbi:MAG TPA: YbaB/EbfC family nucleoid-associated protein [Polyangia bacterium]|jgi:DNA-binding YbaB/EbfC family protein|nr:YbaB/EbfC family nucleoid-associated protein [Polyangia bacterium]